MAWKGLGYYRRGRNLRKIAIEIIQNNKGQLPQDFVELQKIPGIGPYTAGALVAIGRNKAQLAIDANIERVLARYFDLRLEKGPARSKRVREIFEQGKLDAEIAQYGARQVNESLMDVGRVICQSRKASCEICPLRNQCQAYLQQSVDLYLPRSTEKKKVNYELQLLRVIVEKKAMVLGKKREKGQWLEGQVELPTFVLSSEDQNFSQYPKGEKSLELEVVGKYQTTITKYKITNIVVKMDRRSLEVMAGARDSYQFFKNDPRETNFSTASLKALQISI